MENPHLFLWIVELGVAKEPSLKKDDNNNNNNKSLIFRFRDGPFGECSMFHIHRLHQNRQN